MLKTTNLLLVLALAMPACMVSGRGTMSVRSEPVAVYQEPPPPQAEVVTARPGHVWIRGRWDWRNGNWVWVGGHWERERANYYWADGRWENRGNQWIWVEGSWQTGAPSGGGGVIVTTTTSGGGSPPPAGNWGNSSPPPVASSGQGGVRSTSNVTVSAVPNAAPPPARVENMGTKAGFVWVSGRWDWRGGQWVWLDGHWERERANMMWVSGSWQNNGGQWVWVEGSWQARPAAPQGPVVRDHRTH
jgi:hypothetical protein